MKPFTAPDSWHEDYIPHIKECYDCSVTDKKIDKATYWIESILDRLYSPSPNINALESDLDELCYVLGVKMRRGDIQVQSKEETIPEFLKLPKFIQIQE